jgi:hypothetical protein
MNSSPGFQFDTRRAALTALVQMVLVAAAVGISQLDLAGRTTLWLVLALTALNGMLVVFLLLGVKRSGWMVSVFAVITAIFIVNLLAWPAWDIYERVRP